MSKFKKCSQGHQQHRRCQHRTYLPVRYVYAKVFSFLNTCVRGRFDLLSATDAALLRCIQKSGADTSRSRPW